MLDQIKIENVGSLDMYDASISERDVQKPKKKSIRETVPFSNIVYDFSGINGEIYWEESELSYSFEILADSPEELETKKIKFSSWVMNVTNKKIYDPYIPKYHFNGTFSDIKWEDDESMYKSTAIVKFTAYPYMIANELTIKEIILINEARVRVKVINNSSHRIIPTIITPRNISLTVNGDKSFNIQAGTWSFDELMLKVGENSIIVAGEATSQPYTVKIQFYEEIF